MHHHHRIRARSAQRQHADLRPGRPFRFVPALPAKGPYRPRRTPSLRLHVGAQGKADNRGSRAPPAGHIGGFGAGFRVSHRNARLGDSRRRQPAGYFPERPYPGGGPGPVQPTAERSHRRTTARARRRNPIRRRVRARLAKDGTSPDSPHPGQLHSPHAFPPSDLPAGGAAQRPQRSARAAARTPRPVWPHPRRGGESTDSGRF